MRDFLYDLPLVLFKVVVIGFLAFSVISFYGWVFRSVDSKSDTKRQDFKECVDMTHSALWCYDKIR